jgi:hypothetical protein
MKGKHMHIAALLEIVAGCMRNPDVWIPDNESLLYLECVNFSFPRKSLYHIVFGV